MPTGTRSATAPRAKGGAAASLDGARIVGGGFMIPSVVEAQAAEKRRIELRKRRQASQASERKRLADRAAQFPNGVGADSSDDDDAPFLTKSGGAALASQRQQEVTPPAPAEVRSKDDDQKQARHQQSSSPSKAPSNRDDPATVTTTTTAAAGGDAGGAKSGPSSPEKTRSVLMKRRAAPSSYSLSAQDRGRYQEMLSQEEERRKTAEKELGLRRVLPTAQGARAAEKAAVALSTYFRRAPQAAAHLTETEADAFTQLGVKLPLASLGSPGTLVLSSAGSNSVDQHDGTLRSSTKNMDDSMVVASIRDVEELAVLPPSDWSFTLLGDEDHREPNGGGSTGAEGDDNSADVVAAPFDIDVTPIIDRVATGITIPDASVKDRLRDLLSRPEAAHCVRHLFWFAAAGFFGNGQEALAARAARLQSIAFSLTKLTWLARGRRASAFLPSAFAYSCCLLFYESFPASQQRMSWRFHARTIALLLTVLTGTDVSVAHARSVHAKLFNDHVDVILPDPVPVDLAAARKAVAAADDDDAANRALAGSGELVAKDGDPEGGGGSLGEALFGGTAPASSTGNQAGSRALVPALAARTTASGPRGEELSIFNENLLDPVYAREIVRRHEARLQRARQGEILLEARRAIAQEDAAGGGGGFGGQNADELDDFSAGPDGRLPLLRSRPVIPEEQLQLQSPRYATETKRLALHYAVAASDRFDPRAVETGRRRVRRDVLAQASLFDVPGLSGADFTPEGLEACLAENERQRIAEAEAAMPKMRRTRATKTNQQEFMAFVAAAQNTGGGGSGELGTSSDGDGMTRTASAVWRDVHRQFATARALRGSRSLAASAPGDPDLEDTGAPTSPMSRSGRRRPTTIDPLHRRRSTAATSSIMRSLAGDRASSPSSPKRGGGGAMLMTSSSSPPASPAAMRQASPPSRPMLESDEVDGSNPASPDSKSGGGVKFTPKAVVVRFHDEDDDDDEKPGDPNSDFAAGGGQHHHHHRAFDGDGDSSDDDSIHGAAGDDEIGALQQQFSLLSRADMIDRTAHLRRCQEAKDALARCAVPVNQAEHANEAVLDLLASHHASEHATDHAVDTKRRAAMAAMTAGAGSALHFTVHEVQKQHDAPPGDAGVVTGVEGDVTASASLRAVTSSSFALQRDGSTPGSATFGSMVFGGNPRDNPLAMSPSAGSAAGFQSSASGSKPPRLRAATPSERASLRPPRPSQRASTPSAFASSTPARMTAVESAFSRSTAEISKDLESVQRVRPLVASQQRHVDEAAVFTEVIAGSEFHGHSGLAMALSPRRTRSSRAAAGDSSPTTGGDAGASAATLQPAAQHEPSSRTVMSRAVYGRSKLDITAMSPLAQSIAGGGCRAATDARGSTSITHLVRPLRPNAELRASAVIDAGAAIDKSRRANAKVRRQELTDHLRVIEASKQQTRQRLAVARTDPLKVSDMANAIITEAPPVRHPEPSRPAHVPYLSGTNLAIQAQTTSRQLALQFRHAEKKFTVGPLKRQKNRA